MNNILLGKLHQIWIWAMKYALLIMILIMIAVFSFLNHDFLTWTNFKNIWEQNAALAIVAVGATFMIIAQNIDLSPGSLIALSGVMLGLTFTYTDSMPIGIVCCVLFAVAASLLNGLVIVKLHINSVIITLAAYLWMRGLALGFTEASSIPVQGAFVDFMNQVSFLGISLPILLVVLAYAAGWFLLNKTKMGRYTYAIGGDEQAAKHAGIRIDLYKLLIFAFNGLLVGIASIITVSRLASAQPNVASGLELDAIAAVIIGGNRLNGGEGTLQKTILGVAFIAVLNNGLNSLGMRDAYFYFFKGALILIVLYFEMTARKSLRAGAASTMASSDFYTGGRAV